MSLEAAAAEDIIDLASDYFEGIVELYLPHRPEVMKLLRPHSMAIKRMENCSRVTSTTLLAATGLVSGIVLGVTEVAVENVSTLYAAAFGIIPLHHPNEA